MIDLYGSNARTQQLDMVDKQPISATLGTIQHKEE